MNHIGRQTQADNVMHAAIRDLIPECYLILVSCIHLCLQHFHFIWMRTPL